ncbi:cell division protein FtsK [Shewanella sp. Choline-02u-19]|uniref:DNA translocase FtsK n=1 Tax=unclassified Shewanella TaxID=196818 RepID=UPI000C328433|nr:MULTISPECIES: DNA translocase FtsK 4TM domain-containing protein [unclassified Shewanella]PKG59232.1 cell division protein FtsK [Shewanella sp. GutDb-MelDb]PKG73718.1 cell division protein FtsK [Shewanella sp. GutCb]PKH56358.1 cell division protein FtsK [Shewanella sp. Bg11-22]PKI27548.1 cell division protein FtsK [Shewanella sp. Choline-02u-19]
MSKATSVKTLSGVQRLLEGSLIICCMIATYILIALSSFNASDPGWSQSHFDGDIQNLTGAVGAWLADVLLYIFGYTAYIIPVIIALTGWSLFKRTHRLLEIDYFSVGLRLIGFLLIVFSLAALGSMNANGLYEFSAGGVTGDVIGQAMLPYFNQLGTTLLLLCFVGAGFTLLTGISWLTIIDLTGFATLWCFKSLRQLPAKLVPNKEETEDTRGFLSVVERFREKRSKERDEQETCDANLYEQDDSVNPETAKSANTRLEPKIEPLLTQPSQAIEPTIQAPWIADVQPEVETIDFDAKKSTGAVNASKRINDGKAKIVDGIVILPGQEEGPVSKAAMEPLPSISLLDVPNRKSNPISQEELDQVGRLVEVKLADFNITAKVVGVYPGPVITRFELELAPGVKASKITSLSKDLARSLLAESVRVVEVIPGKAFVGLELPNKFRETVFMRDVLDCDEFRDSPSHLSMVLGADIGGKPVIVDLGKMPHLLVAGTTGSGKSVGVNVMITSLLYKSGPDDVRFIMIDPKMLELSVYEGIPHLLCEVVTDMKEAANSLRWCVGEMERRYKLMSALGVRNLKGYNLKIKNAKEAGEPIVDPLWKSSDSMEPEAPELDKLPSIVVVVDEFADMMMIVGKKVEELIARIAQKARAAGIHLILATQRPSVDVITGLIKANIPTRMAFQVSSRIDSRTILDQQGAETLLGMGDMLYLPPGTSVPSRVHGAFIDDHEVHKVVADWHARGKPQYITDILQGSAEGEQVLLPGEASESDEDTDVLYDEAVAFVTQTRRGSISSVQRKFKIGYNRAARIIEQMELQGVVSAQGHNGNREVLAPPPPKDFD